MQLEYVEMANGWEREGVLSEGRDVVAFEANFGNVLAGDQAVRMEDDGILRMKRKSKSG